MQLEKEKKVINLVTKSGNANRLKRTLLKSNQLINKTNKKEKQKNIFKKKNILRLLKSKFKNFNLYILIINNTIIQMLKQTK